MAWTAGPLEYLAVCRPLPVREVSMSVHPWLCALMLALAPLSTATAVAGDQTVVVDAEIRTLDGDPVKLADYRGKALLIVNTASKCGYTKQYAGLEKLYRQYRDRGLVVLGIPSPDFANQEFETAAEIRSFCDSNFDVSFPLMERSHVKGDDKIPLYTTLTEKTPEGIRGEIRWNFTKFLVDPEGRVVQRFEPAVDPMSPELVAAVESLLPD